MTEAQGWLLIGGVWAVVAVAAETDFLGLTAAVASVLAVGVGLVMTFREER